MLQTDPKKIAIYLTNKCNLRCKHCFIEGAPQNDQFLSWKQIETALRYFVGDGFNAVEFTGGESCLSPYLVPATKLAQELGYTVGVNTNGININLPKLLSPEYVDKVTFSLDGATPETHDFLRGEGAFNQTVKTIKHTIDLGFYTEAIFTVHRYNQGEVAKVISLLDDLKVGRLSFNFVSNQGTATINPVSYTHLTLPTN
jgi:MoaA/NifB/PqqE/SkfB family radical SAM enzyme